MFIYTCNCRRVLDKQQRVDAIINSLREQDQDENIQEEVQNMITPTERAQLVAFKKTGER